MNIGLSILESSNIIANTIIQKLSDSINDSISKVIPKIENDLRFLLDESIRNEPEYSSLMAGTLKAELGIPDSSIVDLTIDYFVKNIRVVSNSIRYSINKGMYGNISIELVSDSSIAGAINSDFANIQDVKGYIVPWLQWLLLEGSSILVQNYEVKYGNSPYSRSGMAIMVNSNSSWSVPKSFSGKINNNWITRAINNSEDNIKSIIISNIENIL